MELRKIDFKNLWPITKLSVQETQKDFVATNVESLLEAYVIITSDGVALPFGLYEKETLVGFIMIGYGTTGDEDEPAIAADNYCIWRLMIDHKFQGQGFGKKALDAAISYIKTQPCGQADYCWLSYEPENTLAKHLYNHYGFHENGEICDDEIVAVLKL